MERKEEMNILVNNEMIKFIHDDFPMLVSGAPSAGSSFFSVGLMVSLLNQGEKILLFSAYEQAKELFREHLNESPNDNAMIIESGDGNLFIKQLGEIKDLSERIILFKNIDNYDAKLFDKLKNQELIIYSGDLDKCSFRDDLVKIDFKTKIFFSYPDCLNINDKIDLPKYNGLIINKKYNGVIKLVSSD